MNQLKHLHFWTGIIGVIVFLLTGQYMSLVLDQLKDIPDGPRMLYRSAHIYLLLVSLINLATGVYLEPNSIKRAKILQYFVSIVFIISPFFIITGFFLESNLTELVRPYTRIALFALFSTFFVLILVALKNRNNS
jgi:hypothetical protein